MGKLFTSVLNHRLTIFLEENDIIEQNQAGFRKEYSCADHLFTLHSLFELLKKRKMKLFTAFIDFSQAFDSAGFEIPTYLLAKCMPKLENAS